MCCGDRFATASTFVTTSSATTVASTPQKRAGLGLALSIFFALLALDAVPRVRKRVEALERDFLTAVVAFAEGLRRPIKAAQCLIDVPEKTSFLACEQKGLFSLHGVGALVGHVERVRAEIP